MSKKTPKARRATIRWTATSGTATDQALPDLCYQVLTQAARMFTSDDPALRLQGEGLLRDAAERIATAQIQSRDQAARPKAHTADRNVRIRAHHKRLTAAGHHDATAQTAREFSLSTSTVRRILSG